MLFASRLWKTTSGCEMDWRNRSTPCGCSVASAVIARAKRRCADLSTIRPDVILMDINFPGMNGIECVRRLKETLPEANILMLTVYEESDKIFDSLKAGASGYLLKRTPKEKLMEAIVHVHEGGSPMTGLIARKVVQYFKRLRRNTSELGTLSPREREILERFGEGAAYKEIAENSVSALIPSGCIFGEFTGSCMFIRVGEAVAKFLRQSPTHLYAYLSGIPSLIESF